MPGLKEELAETIKGCSRCGFCMVECPAYGATKIEWDAARGRVSLADKLVKGQMQLDEELNDPADTCLMCRSCYEQCPGKVDTPKAMQIIRTMRYEAGKMPLPYRLVFESVFPHPKVMSLGAHVLSGCQGVGLTKIVDNNLVARSFPKLKNIVGSIPRIPGKQARQLIPVVNPAEGKKQGRVLYFLGCATDLVYPEIAQAGVRLLQMHGVEVVVPPVSCCGLPAYTYGHMKIAKTLAKKNLDVLNLTDQGFDAVVGDCSTCISFLKGYSSLFQVDEEESWRRRSGVMGEKCDDVIGFLLKLGLKAYTKEIKQKVTFHMPCHVARYLNTAQDVEHVARNLPGIDFRKAENQNICCGGAGSYCFTQAARSQKILCQKLAGIYDTDAEFVLTTCPACLMQLQSGLKGAVSHKEIPLVKTTHLMQFMFQAYGG